MKVMSNTISSWFTPFWYSAASGESTTPEMINKKREELKARNELPSLPNPKALTPAKATAGGVGIFGILLAVYGFFKDNSRGKMLGVGAAILAGVGWFVDKFFVKTSSTDQGNQTQPEDSNKTEANLPYIFVEPTVTNSSFPSSSIEAVASKNRLNARDFTRLAKEMNVEHIGNPPNVLLECGLSKEDTFQRIDEIVKNIRETKCLDNYDFKLNDENISMEKIKGGMQGLVYKLKIKGKEFAVKIYRHSAYASQDIAMGAHYLSYQPFKDHVNFYCGSLQGCWVLDEFIPTDASASNRAGMSWFEHVKYFGIINGDLGLDGYNCLGKDKSIVIDRGEEIFDIKGSINISTVEDYKAVLQHPISSIRAEAPGLIFRLGDKGLEIFKLSMAVPESRLKALDILIDLEEHEMSEAISIAAKYPELKEELIKVLNELPGDDSSANFS